MPFIDPNESDHGNSMRRYEQACREANASDKEARSERRKSIEDELVEGGIPAIEEYETLLDERWKRANCLAEYDGIRMGYAIAERARIRLKGED